jgi:hypothetical protein
MAYKQDVSIIKDGVIRDNYDAAGNPDWRIPSFWKDDEPRTFEDWYGMPARKHAYVNAYEVGQGYGGPEEGGWWVTTLEPVASIPVSSYEEACEAVDKLDQLMRDTYGDEREYTSAAGGADGQVSFEPRFAYSQPEEWPRYE